MHVKHLLDYVGDRKSLFNVCYDLIINTTKTTFFLGGGRDNKGIELTLTTTRLLQ